MIDIDSGIFTIFVDSMKGHEWGSWTGAVRVRRAWCARVWGRCVAAALESGAQARGLKAMVPAGKDH